MKESTSTFSLFSIFHRSGDRTSKSNTSVANTSKSDTSEVSTSIANTSVANTKDSSNSGMSSDSSSYNYSTSSTYSNSFNNNNSRNNRDKRDSILSNVHPFSERSLSIAKLSIKHHKDSTNTYYKNTTTTHHRRTKSTGSTLLNTEHERVYSTNGPKKVHVKRFSFTLSKPPVFRHLSNDKSNKSGKKVNKKEEEEEEEEEEVEEDGSDVSSIFDSNGNMSGENTRRSSSILDMSLEKEVAKSSSSNYEAMGNPEWIQYCLMIERKKKWCRDRVQYEKKNANWNINLKEKQHCASCTDYSTHSNKSKASQSTSSMCESCTENKSTFLNQCPHCDYVADKTVIYKAFYTWILNSANVTPSQVPVVKCPCCDTKYELRGMQCFEWRNMFYLVMLAQERCLSCFQNITVQNDSCVGKSHTVNFYCPQLNNTTRICTDCYENYEEWKVNCPKCFYVFDLEALKTSTPKRQKTQTGNHSCNIVQCPFCSSPTSVSEQTARYILGSAAAIATYEQN